jgi:RNA polymerase sigma-70 factor (ECF subfamily)
MRQDLRRRLSDALDALPEEQRQVVMLAHVEGRSYPEIAEILGCPVNTVKTRMFHARRRLKVLLADRRRAA